MNITTPVGTTRYCWLTNASTGQYDGEFGTYRTELILEKSDWEALKARLKPEFESMYEKECIKQGKKELKRAESPFKIDEEGNHYIKTKLKAGGRRQDRDKTVYKLSVARYDSQGNPIKDDTIIGSGSKVKLGIKMRPWFIAAHGFGVTLEPHAVQIIELGEVGGGDKFDFTADENGYVHGGENYELTDEPANAETTEENKPLAADF